MSGRGGRGKAVAKGRGEGAAPRRTSTGRGDGPSTGGVRQKQTARRGGRGGRGGRGSSSKPQVRPLGGRTALSCLISALGCCARGEEQPWTACHSARARVLAACSGADRLACVRSGGDRPHLLTHTRPAQTAAQLDAELDKFLMKDPERAVESLDTELESYMKKQAEAAPEAAAAEEDKAEAA